MIRTHRRECAAARGCKTTAWAMLTILMGLCTMGLCTAARAADQTVGEPPSYPLYCQGPLTTANNTTPFKWAPVGAGDAPPAPEHCAWADRGPRGSERKQPGVSNTILGRLYQVANLPAGKYMAIGVYRSPTRDDDLVVTHIVGFVAPPFSAEPVLPP